MAGTLRFNPFYMTHSNELQKGFVDEFNAKLDTLKRNVQNLTDVSWNAPAAQEFKAEFDEWASKELAWFDEILDIVRRTSLEIEEWLETAETLAS